MPKKYIYTLFLILLATIVTSCNNHPQPLQGYVEGEYTYVASGIGGTLFTLNVTRGQKVDKDALLFTLDPEPDRSAMEEAKASVEQLEAEASFAKKVMERYKDLLAHNATDPNTFDQKQTDYSTKSKNLEAAKKNFAELQWAYHQKTVYAPIGGFVNDTYFLQGEKVEANQPVLSILAPENVRLIFYVPEGKLSSIRIGQIIAFSCDGCKKSIKARINYISSEAEYTPPVIYSQDTRYKLVYLVRAHLKPKIASQFHPGQPVDIYLNG